MYSQTAIRQWRISKYKQLKGANQSEIKDASLSVDVSKKLIRVYVGGEEKENLVFDIPGNRYPKLKFKELSLYVVVNCGFQGFRLTFFQEDKEEFLQIMRNFLTVCEGSRPNSAEKPYDMKSMRPPNLSASRNFSTNFFEPVPNPYATPVPKLSFSQPVYNPNANMGYGSSSQPVYNPYVQPAPFGAQSQPAYSPYTPPAPMNAYQNSYTTSYAEDPFAVFAPYEGAQQSSSASSALSSVESIHSQQSTSTQRSYVNLSKQEPTFSQSSYPFSPILFTPPIPPTPTPTPAPQADKPSRGNSVDQSTQTDDLKELLSANPSYMVTCIRNLMKNPNFNNLLLSVRTEILNKSQEPRKKRSLNTSPVSKEGPSIDQPSLPTTSQPPVVLHNNSDLEYECTVLKSRH